MRSIVRPLEFDYLLSTLVRTSILPKWYMNSKPDNFTCDCDSERIVLALVRMVSRRNANVFLVATFFVSCVLSCDWKSNQQYPLHGLHDRMLHAHPVFVTLSCLVANTTIFSLPDFFCQCKKQA